MVNFTVDFDPPYKSQFDRGSVEICESCGTAIEYSQSVIVMPFTVNKKSIYLAFWHEACWTKGGNQDVTERT